VQNEPFGGTAAVAVARETGGEPLNFTSCFKLSQGLELF